MVVSRARPSQNGRGSGDIPILELCRHAGKIPACQVADRPQLTLGRALLRILFTTLESVGHVQVQLFPFSSVAVRDYPCRFSVSDGYGNSCTRECKRPRL